MSQGAETAPPPAVSASPTLLQRVKNRLSGTGPDYDAYATDFAYAESTSSGSQEALPSGARKTSVTINTVKGNDYTKLYAPIGKYEGMHRYDPKAVWEEEEERKLVRKVRSTSKQSTGLR